PARSSRAGTVTCVAGFIPALGGRNLELAKDAAVGLNFGDVVGKERPDVSWRGDRDDLVGIFARRVAETVGRVVNHQKPAWPHQGLKKESMLLEYLEWIMAGTAQHGHAEDRIE